MRLAATTLLLVLCSICSAETLFVNNIAGSNFNSGSSPDVQGEGIGPLRTIEAALKLAHRSDRIVLAKTNVPYEECITLQGAKHSGMELVPFVIEGNGATLDGTAPIPADQWTYVQGDLYRFNPEHGGYQYLFLDGEPAKQMPRFDGSYVSNFLEPKQWCRCKGAIQFMSEKDKSPYSYDLRYAEHRVGITLYDVANVVIRDLTVQGFQLDGINAHDNAMDCVLVDITATANGRSGISINGASRVKVVDSKLHLNGEVQLRCDNWSTTELFRSELTSPDSPIWTRHVNTYGRGARLRVDDMPQYEVQGWMTAEDLERRKLGDSLDDLERKQELGLDDPFDDDPVDAPVFRDDAPAAPAQDRQPEENDPEPADEFQDDLFNDDAVDAATEEPEADDAEGDLFEDFGDDGNADDAGMDDFGDEDDPFGDEF